jgi:hypothetical protein
MTYEDFFRRCQNEPTVGDFESYLAHSIFGKSRTVAGGQERYTVEMYTYARDQAFERRDEKAARLLFDLSGAVHWKEGDWEGALR